MFIHSFGQCLSSCWNQTHFSRRGWAVMHKNICNIKMKSHVENLMYTMNVLYLRSLTLSPDRCGIMLLWKHLNKNVKTVPKVALLRRSTTVCQREKSQRGNGWVVVGGSSFVITLVAMATKIIFLCYKTPSIHSSASAESHCSEV